MVTGYELLHSSHIDEKNVDRNIADPKGSNWNPDYGGGGSQPLSKEEIRTREEENILRKEQGIEEMRATPIKKDSGVFR